MEGQDAWDDGLRRALNHLYDPEWLHSSPLLFHLGLESRDDPAKALRTVLEQAIEAFRPASPSPVDSKGWRHYQILYGCYVERATQQVVGDRLGITPRHLRREQSAAIEALRDYLKVRYDLSSDSGPAPGPASSVSRDDVEINREMHWLADSFRERSSEVEPVLCEALDLAEGLARQSSVALGMSCDELVPPVAVPPIILRQAVLNLVTAAIRNLPAGGRLRLFAQVDDGRVAVLVTATESARHSWDHLEAFDSAIRMSRRLLAMFGGDLVLTRVDAGLVASIIVPSIEERVTVLAVEDNLDTLDLWRRYVQGTPFGLIEETNPEHALHRAVALHPTLILLDVMMPGVDGWQLLREMRANPALAGTPIIVCTVLPQRDLALSLGAADFIQKPTTGRAFRAVLKRQISAAMRSQ